MGREGVTSRACQPAAREGSRWLYVIPPLHVMWTNLQRNTVNTNVPLDWLCTQTRTGLLSISAQPLGPSGPLSVHPAWMLGLELGERDQEPKRQAHDAQGHTRGEEVPRGPHTVSPSGTDIGRGYIAAKARVANHTMNASPTITKTSAHHPRPRLIVPAFRLWRLPGPIAGPPHRLVLP
jgi:hypothetical protein